VMLSNQRPSTSHHDPAGSVGGSTPSGRARTTKLRPPWRGSRLGPFAAFARSVPAT